MIQYLHYHCNKDNYYSCGSYFYGSWHYIVINLGAISHDSLILYHDVIVTLEHCISYSIIK